MQTGCPYPAEIAPKGSDVQPEFQHLIFLMVPFVLQCPNGFDPFGPQGPGRGIEHFADLHGEGAGPRNHFGMLEILKSGTRGGDGVDSQVR